MEDVQQTQEQKVLTHLYNSKTITDIQALKMYSIRRLAAIVHRLRRNVNIRTELVTIKNGAQVARYHLNEKLTREFVLNYKKKAQ